MNTIGEFVEKTDGMNQVADVVEKTAAEKTYLIHNIENIHSVKDFFEVLLYDLEDNKLISNIIEFFRGRWMSDSLELLVWIIVAFFIYKVGMFITHRISNFVEKSMVKRNMDKGLISFVHNLIEMLLRVVVLLFVLSSVGFSTHSIIAIFAAAGLAVGLALKDSLSNIASGMMIIVLKPFKVGDFIEAAGISGTVESITVFNTFLQTKDNKQIIIPNLHLTDGAITNYSKKPTRRIDLVIGIGYDDDIKKAKKVMSDILESDSRVLKDPKYIIGVDELGESSINFIVRPWVKREDYGEFKSYFLETVKEEFDKNNISIPFPQQDVHIFENK